MPNKRNRQHLNMMTHANNAMRKENEMPENEKDEREKLDPENMSVQDRKMAAIRDVEAQPGVHETLPAAGQVEEESVRKTETETKAISEAVSEAERNYDPINLPERYVPGPDPEQKMEYFPDPFVPSVEEKEAREEEKKKEEEENAVEKRKEPTDNIKERPGTAALRAAQKASRRNRSR